MSKELITRAKNGDRRALNELIHNHKDFAYTIALQHTKNEDDAKDSVQNAFIQVIKGIKGFRKEAQFSTWLYKIVYREALRIVQKRNTESYRSELINDTCEIIEDNESQSKVKELMSILNEQEYLVMALFYLKEKSIKEIIQITNLSKSNIKVILHRARIKLKQKHNETRN
ncbi:sigma-70 family RNA polymerase sigma factor [uncultured Aquimarina sp.]|uniref:RNA polymerase sigma factor n=1 Tax=uncultured Aquimarina sp. TaxID=575652 RepID=UPI00260FE96F|nr:sigma-70 family RNA polymerase sigma factor [uncultured Aquimarina sp.]